MDTVDKFVLLFFTAVIVMVVVQHPQGITGFFSGLSTFTSGTVGAFSRFSQS